MSPTPLTLDLVTSIRLAALIPISKTAGPTTPCSERHRGADALSALSKPVAQATPLRYVTPDAQTHLMNCSCAVCAAVEATCILPLGTVSLAASPDRTTLPPDGTSGSATRQRNHWVDLSAALRDPVAFRGIAIGSGAAGKVYVGVAGPHKVPVAVKVIQVPGATSSTDKGMTQVRYETAVCRCIADNLEREANYGSIRPPSSSATGRPRSDKELEFDVQRWASLQAPSPSPENLIRFYGVRCSGGAPLLDADATPSQPATFLPVKAATCRTHVVALVYELCELGTLDQLMRLRRSNSASGHSRAATQPSSAPLFSEQELCAIVVPIAKALQYLHSQLGVLHRDVKPQNILLKSSGRLRGETEAVDCCRVDVRLGDLGLIQDQDRASTMCGTPCYMAPEVVPALTAPPQRRGAIPDDSPRRGYDGAADVFSLGVTVQAIVSGCALDAVRKQWVPPRDDRCDPRGSPPDSLELLQSGHATFEVPRLWWCGRKFCRCQKLHRDFLHLVNRMTCTSARERITLDAILRHPLVRKYSTVQTYYLRDILHQHHDSALCSPITPACLNLGASIERGAVRYEHLPLLVLSSTEHAQLKQIVLSPLGNLRSSIP